jgi:hypothetical protein
MMNRPKVHFSDRERELMENTEVILTKNVVLQKVKLLLEGLQQKQMAFVREGAAGISYFSIMPKISRGEQYEGLPWLILDYPRYFDGEDTLTVRTMFWWGHFFSSTLQASGEPLARFRNRLPHYYGILSAQEYYCGIHTNPWIHHFGEDNYTSMQLMKEQDFNALINREHIKIARRWPLSSWPVAQDQLFESWKTLLGIAGLIA